MKKKIFGSFAVILSLSLIFAGCTVSGEPVSSEKSINDDVTVPEESESARDSVPENGDPTEEETEPVTDYVYPEDRTKEPTEEPTTEEPTTEEPTESPNIGLRALAVVPNYVNVRTGPSTEYDIVGKIYKYCAAEILDDVEGEDGNWFLITSGNVKGYIKAEFFLVGEEAEAMRTQVGVLKGIVMEDWLRVRSEPDLSTLDNVFTFYERGTEVIIQELSDGWAKIETDDASTGYVYAECLDIWRDFKTAITIEEEEEAIRKQKEAEERARKAKEELEAAKKAQEEARQRTIALQAEAARQAAILAQQQAQAEAAAQAAAQKAAAEAARLAAEAAAAEAAAQNDALTAQRNAVVAFALQYVGHPYVHAGRSLETGTDCSGFTKLVYQHFGYDFLMWYPAGQAEQGIRVDLNDPKPGDLLFYSNSQKYLGHVAMYIGNGQIVHAGTEATGVITSSAYYRNPLFAVRIIY